MALSSSSTLAQVQAAYDDNASFEEDGSVAKAEAFVTACRILLQRLPSSMDHASGSGRRAIQRNLEVLQGELERARSWLAANGGTPGDGVGARHFSFEDLRS